MGRKAINELRFKKTEGFDPKVFTLEIESTYDSESRAGFTTKKSFAPSTIGYGHGNCARYWYIAFQGAEFEDTANAKSKAIMENGTFVHDRLQKRIEKTGRVLHLEKEVTHDDPPIRGFVDVILDWDGKEVPGEIKSAKDEVFIHRQSSRQPSSNHKIQLLTYMKILNYEEGFFMYENKNDQELAILPIKMSKTNEELIDYVFDWLRGVKKLHEERTLPKRAFTKTQSACKYCPVKKVCWSKTAEEGVIEYPAMEVPK